MDASAALFPLTLTQRDIYLDQLHAPDSPLYNIGGYIRMGRVDVAQLQRAHARLVQAHDAFGIRVHASGEGVFQYLSPQRTTALPLHDFGAQPDAAAAARHWLDARFRVAIPAQDTELFSACLLRIGADEYWYCVIAHHLMIDGWGFANLARALGRYYFDADADASLPWMQVAQADADYVQGAKYARDGAYWRERIATMPEPLLTPFHRRAFAARGAVPSGRETVRLAPDDYAVLQQLAARLDTGVPQLLLAAWSVGFRLGQAEDDLVVGLPVHNRQTRAHKQTIGVFTSVMPLALSVPLHQPFDEVVRAIADAQRADYRHQRYPIGQLTTDLGAAGSGRSLYDITFNYLKLDSEFELAGHAAHLNYLSHGHSATPLTLTVWEYGSRQPVEFHLDYNLAYFAADEARLLAPRLLHLLEQIGRDPQVVIGELSALPPAESARIAAMAQGATRAPSALLAHDLVAQQAVRTPAAIALVDDTQSLSYAELEHRAERVAHALQSAGVVPEQRVAVCLERRCEAVIGMLAILKAGAAYVPLDPAYPAQRLAYMIEDCGAVCVLGSAALLRALPLPAHTLALDIDAVLAACGTGDLPERIAPALTPSNLAYVIYTSGSTGQPKGVMVAHAGLVNLVHGLAADYRLGEGDRVLQFSSISFDGASWDWARSLGCGAALYICSDDVRRSGDALGAYLRQQRITHALIPPAALAQVDPAADYALRSLVVGGEACDERLAWTWAEKCTVFNAYGPTECSVVASQARVRPGEPLSIGTALPNGALHVLDTRGEAVPLGAAGELYIAGTGLARGYLGRDALTAERFVHGRGALAGTRLYRSGDRVRRRLDGELEFLGRVDEQLKLRGFRIEPGEIEAALAACAGVGQGLALLQGEGANRFLVAYVTTPLAADADADLAGFVAQVQAELRLRLPDYMQPAVVLPLAALPLTANGKIDRRALPAVDVAAQQHLAAPQTRSELRIAAIWQRVLGLDAVGLDTSFFALGGHSLLAARVAGAIGEEFGKDVALRAVFEHVTVRSQAAHVDRVHAQRSVIVPVAREGRLALSFPQQRLWMLDRLDGGSAHYNLPAAFRIDGPLQVDALREALAGVVRRHDVLRTTFASDGDSVWQVIAEPSALDLPLIDLSLLDAPHRDAAVAAQRAAQAEQAFDLTREPPLRAVLLHLDAQRHVLLLTLHHIAADGASVAPFLHELAQLYSAAAAGADAPLAPLAIQYADYAAWQRERLAGPAAQASLDYWLARLDAVPAVHALPLDRPRPALQSFRGRRLHRRIAPPLAQALTQLGIDHDATLFMVLHAALAVLLGRCSGESDIVVGTPVAGRTQAALEPLVGFFVNTLVLRSDLSGDPGFAGFLQRARHTALGAFEHQDVPFELLVERLQPERSLAWSPLFQILFELQNEASPQLALPGLDVAWLEQESDAAVAKFDLELTAQLRDGAIELCWHYADALFDADTVARLADGFARLLAAIVRTPDCAISRLPVLAPDDEARLAQWAGAGAVLAADACIQDGFERHAREHGTRSAVIAGDDVLSYAGLDARANRLARVLRAHGIGRGDRVGICLRRTLLLPVAVLAVLKTGAAFVPLDPDYPPERLRYILADSGIGLLLGETALAGLLDDAVVTTLPLDDAAFEAQCTAASPEAPGREEIGLAADDLACLIYTSGSTGTPKGVMVSHAAVVNYLAAAQAHYAVAAGERVLQCAAFGFDVFVEECFATLSQGACLVLRDAQTLEDGRGFWRFVQRHALNVIILPTALWHVLADELTADDIAPAASLRLCVIGGEAVQPEKVAAWNSQFGTRVRLLNSYGPTETTVGATLCDLTGFTDPHALAGIGRPLANTRCHVLDADGSRVAPGVPGELYIGGSSVSAGYWNRPELTAARFVDIAGERCYRTGDRVRWSSDGQLHFLGRFDDQIKLRGFRIELGEIETQLRAQDGVTDAVVLLRQDRLVAYLAGRLDDVELPALRERLRQCLPDYMLPSAYVLLAQLPLTANGKVDKRALPEPAFGAHDQVAPRSDTERELVAIWQRLLRREPVGIDDNFFDLGGHSLLAIRVTSEIARCLRRQVGVRALFEHATVRRLAAHLETLEPVDGAAIPLAPRDAPLALSSAQQRLWFIEQIDNRRGHYNVSAALRLRGDLDRAALQRALDGLIARHEILRTVYHADAGEAVQVIRAPAPLAIVDIDLSPLAATARDAALRNAFEAESTRPFDLQRDTMLRLACVSLGAAEHALLFTVHHIACDGWSVDILVREFAALYDAALHRRDAALAPLPLHYADYAQWERDPARDAGGDDLAFWRDTLAGLPVVHNLPLDKPRPAEPGYGAIALSRRLDARSGAALQAYAQARGASLFMALQALLASLLARYSNDSDIVIGTPVANRRHADLEGLIGLFVNTVVLRCDVSGEPGFDELLARVQHGTLAALAHQAMPFERLVDELKPPRSRSHAALFQVMLVLQNNASTALELPGLQVESLEAAAERAEFDVQLTVQADGDALRLDWLFAHDLFLPDTAQRMAQAFERLLAAALEDPRAPLRRLPLQSAEDAATLAAWAGEGASLAPDLCLHEYFEAQVRQDGERVAVVAGAQSLSYAQLDDAANRLAAQLQARGVRRGDRVGICLDRGLDLPASVLAVLKAGAAYVPFDPDYPAERLRAVLADSQVRLLLTHSALAAVADDSGVAVLCVDTDLRDAAPESPGVPARDAMGLCGSDLAYLIYTSGSTGTPKGVMVSHAAAGNYLAAAQRHYAIRSGERVLQCAAFGFDAFVEECFMALSFGACLVLRDATTLGGAAAFWDFVARHRVDVVSLPTALWHLLVDELDASGAQTAAQLRLCILGGEAVQPARVAQWTARLGRRVSLLNSYGPTEATVVATVADLTGQDDGAIAPIGRPLANTRCHVLDAFGEATAPGIPGELYIGGSSLAAGYWNRPDLTAERFVHVGGERCYRSGDRVRWGSDGQLQFLGRIDDQLKLRGFRIEPGEIEACLRRCSGVADAVVLLRDERLVAYLAADGDASWLGQLRAGLRNQLPDYMQPTDYVVLAQLPLTPNGKIDKRALPAPQIEPRAHVAPRTATEQQLAQIWQTLLRRERVGIDDNFFELGGHSLLAIRVVSEIARALGRQASVRALFEHTSVRELAAHLDAAASVTYRPIAGADRRRPLPLSYAQQRLWFVEQLEGGSAQFNMPAALRLRGALDRGALQQALDGVLQRHEILRTVYRLHDGEAVQHVLDDARIAIDAIDLRALAGEQRERDLRERAVEQVERRFDLANGPLLRCALVELGDDDHVLLLTVHHIAVDGWSLALLVREFVALYAAARDGHDAALPALPLQYADYASWQRETLGGASLATSLGYWRERLAGVPAVHGLPLDRPRPAQQDFASATLHWQLDAALLDAARRMAQQHGSSLFMLLQAVFAATLSRWSGESDIVIGTPVSGRTHKDTEGLIGFFVNTLALRTDLSGDPDFATLLRQVRNDTLAAFGHQDVPFELVIEELRPERSLAYSPVCQIKFVLQNQDAETLALPGLDITPLDEVSERIRFDLDLTGEEIAGKLMLSLSYKTALFERASMARLAAGFERVLAGVLAEPHRSLRSLPLLDAAGQADMLQLGHGPRSDRHRAASLVQQFAQQAARTPDAIAVRDGDVTLSYAQLDAKANRLAHVLAEQGQGRGTRVGVHLDRSAELLVALLGVMKSGAAYVMLDTRQSAERLRAIVADADIAVVLLDSRRAVLPVAGLDTVFVDDAAGDADWLAGYGDDAPDTVIDADDSAYVLYTSGSTGQPKGVEIRHGGLNDYCAFAREGYYAEQLRGSIVATSPAFDLTIPSLYVPLLNGGCVELMPAQDELVALAARLDGEGDAALLRLTPSHLQGLLDLSDAQPRDQAHVFVIGGEAFAVNLARALQAKYPQAQIYNHYGPTEIVVGCSWYDVTANLATLSHAIPIGRPMSNTQLLVLDAQQQPVPVGVAGELYIGGAGVAKGYLNLPELTAQKFVANPFDATQRLYRSGDRVRWLADGNLEFLGRLDDQVKIRGFRIELGDIESRLRQIAGVREAAVAVHGDGQLPRLVAYLVGDEADLVERVTSALAEQLPAYLQPGAYVQLDRLPLTLNGKIDRKALPEPGQASDTFVAPDGETEQRLAAIWAQILRQERISAEANFFALGGHSLLATRIVSEIAKQFAKPVPVRALFEHSSVRKLARYLDAQAASGYAAIARQPRAENLDEQGATNTLPLSFAQQRLWFIDTLEGGSRQYNMPAALRLRGALDIAALQAALDAIVARHEILRTRYASVDGEPVQVIVPARPLPLAISDLRTEQAAAREQQLGVIAHDEASRAFDLACDVMLRCRLVLLGHDDHALLFTVHHIASDGWSTAVLVREFVALYAAHAQNREPDLAPLPIQYADYAAWQRRRLQGEALQTQVGYWREHLAGLPVLHQLPLDRPRPAQQRFAGAAIEQVAPLSLLQDLKALALRHDASLFMLLQAAFAVLLGRWSGAADIVVGTPIAGRTHPDLEPLIGFFVNTLVLRTDLAGDPRLEQVLEQVRTRALAAYAHQDVPFEMLVDELKPVRSLSHAPLFQILFSLKNTAQAELTLPGLQIASLSDGDDQAKFDLQLTAEETAAGLRLSWLYAQDLFDAASIARLGTAYAQLLQAFAATPQRALSEVVLADAAGHAQIDAWNSTQAPFAQQCFHRLFEAQAQRSPDAVAVRDADAALSYAQLDRRANRLAHVLRERGAAADTLVGVCLPRSVDQAVAVLGILKAGAAYLPLDPGSPDAHLQYIVRDSGALLLLVDDASRERLRSAGAGLLEIADPAIARAPAQSPDVAAETENLAYCIYTSGSSGRPKGVLIEHRSLANLAANLGSDGIAGGIIRGRWALAASTAFDGSIKALVQWAHGGEVLFVPEATKLDAAALREWLAQHRVDVMDCTPSLLAAWLAAGLDDCLPNLVIGGEPIDRTLWQHLVAWQRERGRYAINVYGPTECCVDTTSMRIAGSEPVIGRPLANVQCHVLDAQGRTLPPGVAGELYIGGIGVGRGYINQPELTAQKFVEGADGARLYRSGDRARWRNDGTLEYLGRLDDQVKLRGFRIELGEIESRLRLLGAREAAVVVCGDGAHARLVAYVAGDGDDLPDRLRSGIAAELPAYLQPAAYVRLPRLPLTVNGKADRRALPEPAAPELAFVAPQGDTELRLAAIWSRILRQDTVSADANFFALGGHSLLATRVASEIAKTFGKPLPVRALFEHGSVRALAAHLDAQPMSGYAAIPRVPRDEVLPLSFAQQRLWFIDRLEGGSRQYHMPAALRLAGRLDRAALQASLDALVARHEVLRTRFAGVDDMPVQVIGGAESVAIAISDLRALDAAQREAQLPHLVRDEAAVPFDLSRDLLLRCRLIVLGDDEHALVLTLHHIASDGWSTAVMVREFAALYGARIAGREADVPALRVQYADYAAWQRGRLQGDALQAQVGYWREQLAGLPTLHELPLDKPRPAQQRFAGARIGCDAPAPLLAALKALALAEGASLFMLLEAAFAVLIGRWSGARDVVVGTPIAGRVHPELDDLIGCFVNTLVLRTDLDGNPTFLDVLAQTRTRALAAYGHQDVPFDLLVDELKPARSLSHAPLFQLLFSMKNTEHAELVLPGLTLSPLQDGHEQAKFDMQLSAEEGADGLRLSWLYAQDLFDTATVVRLGEAYVQLLDAIVASPQQRIAALPLMNERAVAAVRDFGHGPHSTTHRDFALPRQFAQQAARTPHAPAVRAGDVQLSYAQLDAASNRVAHALRARGQGRGTRVGVHLDRSAGLLVALLGVMKSGAAYVMLDTRQSVERLRAIVADAAIAVVLLDGRSAILPVAGFDTVFVDGAAMHADWLADYGDDTPDTVIDADDSAYVLYTSGSTGQPKGVEIRHGGLTDYCAFAREGYYAEHLGGSIVATSPAFDLTIPSLYVPLLDGGCVELMPAQDELAALAAHLDGEGAAALLRLTPSHLQGLLDLSDAQPRDTRHVFVIGGEAFAVDLARALQAKYPQAQIYNHYGPTETVVGCSWYDVTANLATLSHAIPIGRPMSNTQLLVLDAQQQPVPIGVAGELYIGGAGVAKGYLNLPELTAQKFVPHPFDATQRLYRSGDRVRWLADGNLEFLGRLDDQVKIRGFRIELGDIESRLRQIAGVREAAVAVHGDGAHARLVAYLVGDDTDLVERVTGALAEQLPAYLQPGAYVQLDRLPLTLNGKVDRKALPAPTWTAEAFVAADGETETQLAGIWQQVLGLEQVSVTAGFFDLGGHSLLATRLVNAVQRHFRVELPIRAIFEKSDIRSIAALIDAQLLREHNLTLARTPAQHVEMEW